MCNVGKFFGLHLLHTMSEVTKWVKIDHYPGDGLDSSPCLLMLWHRVWTGQDALYQPSPSPSSARCGLFSPSLSNLSLLLLWRWSGELECLLNCRQTLANTDLDITHRSKNNPKKTPHFFRSIASNLLARNWENMRKNTKKASTLQGQNLKRVYVHSQAQRINTKF